MSFTQRTQDRRREGTTTSQMQDAPKGALFVWCTSDLWYPKDLAVKTGRTDLRIERPGILEQGAYRLLGTELPGVVVDHACRLTIDQLEGLDRIRPYIRPPVGAVSQ